VTDFSFNRLVSVAFKHRGNFNDDLWEDLKALDRSRAADRGQTSELSDGSFRIVQIGYKLSTAVSGPL
jgi:hypothetical protein